MKHFFHFHFIEYFCKLKIQGSRQFFVPPEKSSFLKGHPPKCMSSAVDTNSTFCRCCCHKKTSLQVYNAAVCTKILILISPHPNVCIPCVEVKQKQTNIALSIPFRLLNKAIFGLGGLEFCQKMWN